MQLRALQPLGFISRVSQELRHPFVGLSHSGHHHRLPVLTDAFEVDALGRLRDEFVQQMDRHIAVDLQIFHRFLTGFEGLNFSLQAGDVLDVVIQFMDFSREEIVALLLVRDQFLLDNVAQTNDHRTGDDRQAQTDEERLLAQLAFLLAVRE